jgi:hypothetical protein
MRARTVEEIFERMRRASKILNYETVRNRPGPPVLLDFRPLARIAEDYTTKQLDEFGNPIAWVDRDALKILRNSFNYPVTACYATTSRLSPQYPIPGTLSPRCLAKTVSEIPNSRTAQKQSRFLAFTFLRCLAGHSVSGIRLERRSRKSSRS